MYSPYIALYLPKEGRIPSKMEKYILSLASLEFAVSPVSHRSCSPCYVTGGTIVLFDRKMLRNFRKDGHNWKKKKDGKTVKEAHEHLKVCLLFYFSQV